MKSTLAYAKPDMFEQAEAGVPAAFEKKRVQFFEPIFPEEAGTRHRRLYRAGGV